MDKTLADHSGHRDRLRRRFISEGADSFEPHQLLEMLLFYAVPRKDTNPLAHRLIDEFGSLRNVLDAPLDALTSAGLTQNAAVLIKTLPAFCRAYASGGFDGVKKFSDRKEIALFLCSRFTACSNERFAALLMDNSYRMMKFTFLGEGGPGEVDADLRSLVAACVNCSATTAVIAHNHPKGSVRPSSADISVTRDVKNLLGAIGVKLIDHVVVSGEDYCLMSQLDGLPFSFR